MKDGYIIKGLQHDNVNELELINQYTRRKLTDDEVYTFSVVLCDNEIDRDYEKFSNESLQKLADLFIGKTGIVDHDAKSDNQKARIFSCKVEKVEGRYNSLKEDYYRLVARAYIPKSEKNSDLILEIDTGIKKEVSVGCSVNNKICSICGADLKSSECNHKKGKSYDGQVCYVLLENPVDAYEWSFVAVPAQKEAGVIKAFNYDSKGGNLSMEDIIKKLNSAEECLINKNEAIKLAEFIESLKQQAQDGKVYREELRKEVVRLCSIAQPELNNKIMDNLTVKMSIDELKAFKKAFIAKTNEIIPPKPQLFVNQKEKLSKQNIDYKM